MVWRTRHDGSQKRPETALAELVVQLETGSATAESRLHASFNTADGEQTDAILDALAASAAAGSPYSLELLLGFVSEKRLAAGVIGRHVNSTSLAEEVEQEVLIAVARSIHRYRGDAKFTTWLYSLTRNTGIAHLRRVRPTSVLVDEHLSDYRHSGQGPRRRMSSQVTQREAVRQAIDSLPPPFRQAVFLRDIEGLSYGEIAERLGLEVNTVRSRLSRGRAMLAVRLALPNGPQQVLWAPPRPTTPLGSTSAATGCSNRSESARRPRSIERSTRTAGWRLRSRCWPTTTASFPKCGSGFWTRSHCSWL